MSLTVKHLNADTTFLLTFRPAFAPAGAAVDFPGSFNILIDPWLSGHSSVWTPSFQISHHTSAPCIQSLQDIAKPDLIIISQDKPDHCHKETLCTLPANSRIPILATPAAAKKIRSWKHFTHASISTFTPYKADKAKKTLVSIAVPSYSARSAPGEVTIAYMPQKLDATALHNAIGITYRAPGTTTVTPSGSITALPLSPPSTPPVSTALTPASFERSTLLFPSDSYFTPPVSPTDSQRLTLPSITTEKTLSVLYSPHGVSLTAVMPYANTHLAGQGALPLTALFHSMNEEDNPWFMGGKVAAGYPGGEEMVRALGAKTWISAHDEAKDNRGWSVTWIKSKAYTIDEVQKKLDEDLAGSEPCVGHTGKKAHTRTKVVNLDSGETMRVH